MMYCWNRNRCDVDSSPKIFEFEECLGGKFLSDGSCAFRIGIDHSDKFEVACFLLQLAIDACMIAPKSSAAYHGNTQHFVRLHSKNRKCRICQTAATPSRQVIFLPSS